MREVRSRGILMQVMKWIYCVGIKEMLLIVNDETAGEVLAEDKVEFVLGKIRPRGSYLRKELFDFASGLGLMFHANFAVPGIGIDA